MHDVNQPSAVTALTEYTFFEIVGLVCKNDFIEKIIACCKIVPSVQLDGVDITQQPERAKNIVSN